MDLKHRFLRMAQLLSFGLAASAAPAYAEVTDQEALEAQTASVLASVVFAEKHCPALTIDQAKLASLIERTGKTRESLMEHEDYIDQRDVIEAMSKQHPAGMLCSALSKAHGGYGRGVISVKR